MLGFYTIVNNKTVIEKFLLFNLICRKTIGNRKGQLNSHPFKC